LLLIPLPCNFSGDRTNLEFKAEKLTADGGSLDFKIDFCRADMLTCRRWHRRVGNARRTRAAFGCSHICEREHFAVHSLRIRGRRRRKKRMRSIYDPPVKGTLRTRDSHHRTPTRTEHKWRKRVFCSIFFTISPRYYVALDLLASDTGFLPSIIEPSW